jgi:lipopolysaccharide export system permease protein
MSNSFFPSSTISWYVARIFLLRSLAVLFALALVLQTLDLLGESGNVLAHKGNGSAELWTYLSLRLPQIIAFLLPFSILLGTLITLATLNQNSEVISMKAAGLSAHQVLAPLIVAAFGVALVSFAFNDRIVARASATLDRWQRADYGPIPMDQKSQTNVWVRDGDHLIHASEVNGRGPETRLLGVTIYNRAGGSLLAIVRAPRAAPKAQGWMLSDASRFDVARGVETRLGNISVGTGVRPDQFTLARVNANGLSFRGLWKAIADLREAGRPTGALEAGLWHKLAGPLSTILMPLLGAVAAFGLARSGMLLVRAVIGMALGFAYFVADNFGLAMGNLGAYPPLLAAWGPFFLFLFIGEAVLIQTEE